MLEITRPTLLVNEKVARVNIREMNRKAALNGMAFRPHFKTHVSHEIGRWFRDEGIETCTVSSVEMAAYFQKDGWNDITIAFPFNRLEINMINRLVANGRINLVVEDADTLRYLNGHLNGSVDYFIKLDVGTHRTGLPIESDFSSLISNNEQIRFKGFLAHAGHSYRCRSHGEIKKVYEDVSELLGNLKKKYPNAFMSYGDTPTCSIIDSFASVDELRPGNFIFYDLMQHQITSCTFEQIAVCMAVPVVAKHPHRQEVVVHGGAVHFSKDFIRDKNGNPVYGILVKLTEDGWEMMENQHFIKKLSQEHGIIGVNDEEDMRQIKVGDIVGIIPVHSCLTANLMGKYTSLDNRTIFHMNRSGV